MREAELQFQGIALHRAAITNADHFERRFVTIGHALHHVGDQGARQTPHRLVALGFTARSDRDLVVGVRDFDFFHDAPVQLALGALHRNVLAAEGDRHPLRNRDGLFADTRHLKLPLCLKCPCLVFQEPPFLPKRLSP